MVWVIEKSESPNEPLTTTRRVREELYIGIAYFKPKVTCFKPKALYIRPRSLGGSEVAHYDAAANKKPDTVPNWSGGLFPRAL